MKCKFCGEEVKIPVFKNTKTVSCGACGKYCNQICKKHDKALLSWHIEPCIKCEHNPYKKRYIWDGKNGYNKFCRMAKRT